MYFHRLGVRPAISLVIRSKICGQRIPSMLLIRFLSISKHPALYPYTDINSQIKGVSSRSTSLISAQLKKCPMGSLNLFSHTRLFHISHIQRQWKQNGNQRPPKVLALKFSVFSLFFSTLGILALLFTIAHLAGLFLVGVVVLLLVRLSLRNNCYSFYKKKLLTALRSTNMRISLCTLNGLRKRSIEQLNNQQLNDFYEAFKQTSGGFNMSRVSFDHEEVSSSKVDRLFEFVNLRIKEAFDKDESGIRSYFTGVDKISSIEIDTSNPTLLTLREGKELITTLGYRLNVYYEGGLRHCTCIVVVAALGDIPLFVNIDVEKDKIFPMALAIMSPSYIFKQIIILTDRGDSNVSSYTVQKTKDGHHIYTQK